MGRRPKCTLREKYPDIDTVWHPTKNGDLCPDTVGVRSEKIAWFRCPKDSGHDHQARVKDKTLVADRRDARWGCPYCSSYRFGSPENSLADKRPDLAKEWHLTKNSDLTPENISFSSNRLVWWQCERGHEYQLEVNQRSSANRGCTECSRYAYSSSQELRIYCELKTLFKSTKFRGKYGGKEIDICLHDIGIAIEYDSAFYHQDKCDEDLAKNLLVNSLGFNLIRVRERPLEPITSIDVITPTRQLSKHDLNRLVQSILKISCINDPKFDEYIASKDFVNDNDFAQLTKYTGKPVPENSLAEMYPEVSEQWDYDKNFPLTPYDFSHGSKYRAWWICENGHSFDATINARTFRADTPYKGCRYCSRQRKSVDEAQHNIVFGGEE